LALQALRTDNDEMKKEQVVRAAAAAAELAAVKVAVLPKKMSAVQFVFITVSFSTNNSVDETCRCRTKGTSFVPGWKMRSWLVGLDQRLP
jgi:hypothetical protein